MAPARLGIIGYGIMGERLVRAAVDHDPAVIRVAGVWDPASQALERLGRDRPAVARLASPEEVIEAADCLYVASPPTSHPEYARRAFAQSRAVFCEKPLAIEVEAGRRLVEEAERQGARAGVNFPFASSFAVDQLRAWIEEGAVGPEQQLDVKVAFAHWPRAWQADAAGWLARRGEGGFTREVVSHFLFLARRLLGPLRLRSASTTYPEGDGSETTVRAQLTAGDVPVALTGQVGGTEKADHNLWTLEGKSGAVRLRDWSIAERRQPDGTWQQAADAMPNEKVRPLVLKRQLDKVAAMTRAERHDLATLREALEVQETVEAILAR